jgi:hypothetical protein
MPGDTIHPLTVAQTLADAVPGARFQSLTGTPPGAGRRDDELAGLLAQFIASHPAAA